MLSWQATENISVDLSILVCYMRGEIYKLL